MNKILFGSTNKGKFKEAKHICNAYNLNLVSPNELGLQVPDIIEDGKDYYENALIKAKEFHRITTLPVISDDAGLEVLSLNNQPGIYSGRYAGEPCNMRSNIDKLLKNLTSKSDRSAKFKCCIVYYDGKNCLSQTSDLDGAITLSEVGSGGFGYDGVFKVKGYEQTLSQIKENNFNFETHRLKALKRVCQQIIKLT
ncbi:UNVERIFIED_CONTAM: hypothetical protein GTU68_037647 [Idotea baltica]|nr:hypothetical protein [Idotea baltica]